MTHDPSRVDGAILCFGPFTFDTKTLDLSRDGAPVAAEPQSLRLLAYLIAERDRVVSRADLTRVIWHDRAISDWAISAAIKALRVALGDTGPEKQILRTLHGRGFRFVADVTPSAAPPLSAAPAPDRASQTVLVRLFRARGNDADQAYLAMGLTEDLITDLSQYPELQVLSLGASQALGTDAPDPARGVARIIEGSLRQIGPSLRITLAILDGTGQQQLWAERFDLSPDALLAAQARIMQTVASIIAPGALPAGAGPNGTLNSAAYDAYLKGRYAYFRYEPAAFAQALDHFRTAAALDPGFAEAFAQQAYCRTTLYVFGLPGADKSLDAVVDLARSAVALDQGSALAHARLGWTLGYLGQEEAVTEAFETARACAPGNPEVLLAYGETMNRLARPDRAVPLLSEAFARDAFFPPSWAFARGHAALLLGDAPQALARFQSVLDRVDRFIPARVQRVRALHDMGDRAAAAADVARLRTLAPKYSRAHARRMFPYPDPQVSAALDDALSAAGLP